MTVLGGDFIDSTFGDGTAYKVWQESKARAGSDLLPFCPLIVLSGAATMVLMDVCGEWATPTTPTTTFG